MSQAFLLKLSELDGTEDGIRTLVPNDPS